jgi:Zn-finger nucleic acid-binding protein
MNCRNCAAPMELFDRRRYFFCRHCGSFEFLERNDVDGVQVLERRGDGLPCPLCRAPLAKSLLDSHHPVQYCERCRGVVLERAAFANAVTGRRARGTGPGAPPPAGLDRRELERRVTCPSCRKTMDVHPYYGPGNVIIDTCATCNLVWLDFGELKQIGDAPGQDRGRVPVPPLRRPSTEGRLSEDAGLTNYGSVELGVSVVDVLFDLLVK